VRQVLGQGKRFSASCQRLVRITEIPEVGGCTAEANHALILAKERNMGTVLKGIVMGNPLFEMIASGNELSQPETGDS
jgi:hypothetical protein